MEINLSILKACQQDDRKAQFELFQICFGFIMSICLRYYINKEDAKEVANMVFMKVLKKIGTFQNGNSFQGWLRRITINTIIDEFRKTKNKKSLNIEYEGDELVEVSLMSNLRESSIDIEVMKKMIQELPENQRLAFNMVVIDGYSHKEHAEMTNLSLGTSKWLVHAARKTLQAQVKAFFNLKSKNYVKT